MKRFWLPTQKGTELFPKVTQQPTKLAIRGVPPRTPLYRAVASKFSGHLKQFHAKQQQAYALSENQIHRGRIDWGGARATYTNIQGQEILELEVDTQVLEAISKSIREKLHDYLLITLHFADMEDVRATCSAFLVAPKQQPWPTGVVPFSYPGTGYDLAPLYTDDGSEHPSIAYPPIASGHARFEDPFVEAAADGTQRSTLLVDLTRRLWRMPVIIDIHGALSTSTRTCVQFAWQVDETTYTIASDETTVLFEWDNGDPDEAEKSAEIADLEANHQTTVIDPPDLDDFMYIDDPRLPDGWSGIQTTTSVGYGVDSVGIHHSAHRVDQVSTLTWLPRYHWVVAPGDVTRPVAISGAIFDGDPGFGIAHYFAGSHTVDGGNCEDYFGGAQEFWTWEVKSAYPELPGDMALGTSTATSTHDGPPERHTNPYICTIMYDALTGGLGMHTKGPTLT
jgi:hypothetical protein